MSIMRGPLRFSEGRNGGRCDHGRGLIQLYILHSLKKEQKSGYDLIKEISQKTNGTWVPSKGTLYPMLTKMEQEGLIVVSETGKRSKTIFQLTEKGKNTLKKIVTEKKAEKEKMFVYRNLLFEIFGEESDSPMSDIMKMHLAIGKIAPEKQEKVQELIKKCLLEIERLDSDEYRGS